MSQRHRIFSGF